MSTKSKIGLALAVVFNMALSITESVPWWVVVLAWVATALLGLGWLSWHYFGRESEPGPPWKKRASLIAMARLGADDLAHEEITVDGFNAWKEKVVEWVNSTGKMISENFDASITVRLVRPPMRERVWFKHGINREHNDLLDGIGYRIDLLDELSRQLQGEPSDVMPSKSRRASPPPSQGA